MWRCLVDLQVWELSKHAAERDIHLGIRQSGFSRGQLVVSQYTRSNLSAIVPCLELAGRRVGDYLEYLQHSCTLPRATRERDHIAVQLACAFWNKPTLWLECHRVGEEGWVAVHDPG
jgi:hypothetical protein